MTDIARILGPVYRRIMLMVGRGTLSLTDDGRGTQRMQVALLDGETRDVADRVQQYGISSHPPAGSHVVVLNVGGQRDHPIIIGADDPAARPTGLAPGEVMLWAGHGQRVHLRQDGGGLITTSEGHRVELLPGGDFRLEGRAMTLVASDKVRMEAPVLEVTGDIIDNAGAGGVSMADMRDAYNIHTHPVHAPVPPTPLMDAP